MSDQPDLASILAMENPDVDVFGTIPETLAQVEPAPAAHNPAQSAQIEQQPAPTPDANPFDEGSKQHTAFERLREAERDRADAREQAAYNRAIVERDQQWQQSMAIQHQPQEEEAPPETWEPGYAEYVRKQARAEVSPEIHQLKAELDEIKRSSAQAQQQTLMSATNVPVETLQQAHAYVTQHQPWMIAGLNGAPNPYKALLDHAKQIGFAGQTPAVPATQTPAPIPETIRNQVLQEEAAKRAAQGLPPQMQTPRGVGSVPAGAGYQDTQPPPSEYVAMSQRDPAAWAEQKAKILSQ